MSYREAVFKRDHHIRVLYIFILTLIAIIGFLMFMSYEFKKAQVIRVPSSLGYELRQKMNDAPPEYVYQFGLYILQQVYTWKNSGGKDFGENIYKLQGYLTPNMRKQLNAELQFKASNGELRKRVRWVREAPGRAFTTDRVKKIGPGRWTIIIDLEITEYVYRRQVKKIWVRYPIKIVHYDVDPEVNSFGLALDGYDSPGPKKIKEDDSHE